MKDLLRIQGLDYYWFADNIDLDYQLNNTLIEVRAKEINDSLERYAIDNFVVLDDLEGLLSFFPNNCVITHNNISTDDMYKCIKILRKTKY